jgi:hypothetical protein
MKRIFGVLLGVSLALWSPFADALELGTPAQEHPYQSPQHFALEVRFSPYRPEIDDEPGLQGTPFADSFGRKPRLSMQLELDWQTLRIPHLGTIGPGLGVGVVSFSTDVRTESGRESGDETSLTINPFWLSAVLRADVLWRDLGFPLVPYGKLGVGLGLWRASNAIGIARSEDGARGRGATLGTHMALGLAFALNRLDHGAAKNMDAAVGINNTYVYAEYYWLNLNGFGRSDALRVGTNTWAAGLAFEF